MGKLERFGAALAISAAALGGEACHDDAADRRAAADKANKKQHDLDEARETLRQVQQEEQEEKEIKKAEYVRKILARKVDMITPSESEETFQNCDLWKDFYEAPAITRTIIKKLPVEKIQSFMRSNQDFKYLVYKAHLLLVKDLERERDFLKRQEAKSPDQLFDEGSFDDGSGGWGTVHRKNIAAYEKEFDKFSQILEK